MQEKHYKHKYKQVTTDKYVLRLVDKREEMPKTDVKVYVSGTFKEEATLSIAEARDLERGLHAILRRVK